MENPYAAMVAENVRVLRKERGLGLADLSARLAELGRPLSLKVLSKMELGDRGIDVDDLVALAGALDVTPERLLMPPRLATERRVAELAEQWAAQTTQSQNAIRAAAITAAQLRAIVEDDGEAQDALERFFSSRFPEGSHWPRSLVEVILEAGDDDGEH